MFAGRKQLGMIEAEQFFTPSERCFPKVFMSVSTYIRFWASYDIHVTGKQ